MTQPTDTEIQQAQSKFNQAMEAKQNRQYDNALNVLQPLVTSQPMILASPQVWQNIFNAPTHFANVGEDNRYFDYANTLISLVADSLDRLSTADAMALATSFISGTVFRHTVHNQRSLKDFMSARAKLMFTALKAYKSPHDFNFKTSVSSYPKIRFGVLLKHLRSDPELTSVLPFFNGVKGEDLELTIILASKDGAQDCVDLINKIADHVVYLPEGLPEAVQTVRNLDLDIALFGNDITAKPSLFAQLAFYRLARKSAVCVSTIATTASPYIDWYFGSPYHYKNQHENEFHERVIPISDPGYSFWFPDAPKGGSFFSRQRFGIDENAILLVSGANQTKLHTDLIRLWADILHQVPSAVLFLYPFPPHFGPEQQAVIDRILNDFTQLRISPSRITIFEGIPSRNIVVDLLTHMDLGLDSSPYPGVTTIVDAVESNLPTLTCVGKNFRTAQGAMIMDAMGIDELITHSTQEYVNRAVELCNQPEQRQQLKKKMAAAPKPFIEHKVFSKRAARAYRHLYQEMAEHSTETNP